MKESLRRFTHEDKGSLNMNLNKITHRDYAQLPRQRVARSWRQLEKGPSASRPPVLDGKNYLYWKPRMIFFIKTLDGRAWRALVAIYDPPMSTVDGVSVSKSKVEWTDAKEQASVENATLNGIFNGVDLNVFKLINSCTTVKEAWRILEVAYESTSKVKITRLN
ncbi:gag-pol polyprotein [Cucumis melo var. makuwa]|uniref:Gag-pol polyprotein n=1 Tax=Cucumis melo var. makuwa TaxID=1194695 RepID=A0A5D3DRY9_CUCMM|nr:gag-pol polyprotein [Cucumis melo var. makuwa]TYK26189.1 gag-pol polyprotein [Cucumis melo var. makuwa]